MALGQKGGILSVGDLSVSFADITGNPGDNATLVTYLETNYLKLSGGNMTGTITAVGVDSIDPVNRTLKTASGSELNWGNHLLQYAGQTVVNWDLAKAYDWSAVESYDWNLRLLRGGWGGNFALTNYADNAAAITGGLVAGDLYRTSGAVMIVT